MWTTDGDVDRAPIWGESSRSTGDLSVILGRRTLAFAVVAAATVIGLSGCASNAQSNATALAEPETEPTEVTGTVWVADEGDNSLTVIDAASSKVVATVTGISAPHNVQASPDGATVWAVSGTAQAVVALDASTHELLGSAPTGAEPAHVVVSPDGQRVYVTNSGDNTLSVYGADGVRPLGKVELGAGPHGMRPTADGAMLVIADTVGDVIDLVDTHSRERKATIPVGRTPVQVAVDAEGRYAYVSLAGERAIAQIDLTTRTVVRTVHVRSAPIQLYLTPDGTRLLSANQGTEQKPGRTVSVIDVPRMKVSATIVTGAGPHGVVIDSSGDRAWVTNTYDDTVSVLDLTTNTVIGTVPVGDAPNGITFVERTTPPNNHVMALDIPDYSGDAPMDGMHDMGDMSHEDDHDH